MESKQGNQDTAPIAASEAEAKIEEAGRKAIECRRRGFHCSESVFMAINETLNITDPSLVRIVTGFHGGGGTHRTEPGIDLTSLLEKRASGEDRRPAAELPITQVGHLCGALAAGIVCLGFLHGRRSPGDDLTCVDELSYELHRRFKAEFGENECFALREKYVQSGLHDTCEFIYRRGAQIAVELILEADQLVPECQS
jgi:hypothetical protein